MNKLIRRQSSEQPYYTEETIYNHEKCYVNESETPSFLKESFNATPTKGNEFQDKAYPNIQTNELVQQLGSITDRLYNSCLHRANMLTQQISRRKIGNHTKSTKSIKVKTLKLKDLIVEEKQNKCEFKEKPLVTEEHKDDYGNFQMDENLNYVQDGLNYVQNVGVTNLQSAQMSPIMIKENWLSSEQNCSTIKIKTEFNGSVQELKTKKIKGKYSKITSQERPKGVYEEVLSLYSTAKLIALKRQYN